MTAKPTFTSQISLGNWITIGAMIGTLAVGWGLLQAQQAANQLAIVKIETELTSMDIRVRKLETEDARAQERISSMLTLLNRIDSRLERIERNSE